MSDEYIDSPTRPNNPEELHEHGRPVRCLEYELGQSVSLLVVCSTWFDIFFIRKSAGGDVSLPLFYVCGLLASRATTSLTALHAYWVCYISKRH
jgi:hypothetical protein